MDIATPEKVVEEAKAAAPAAETPKIEVKATVGGVDCARLRSLIERVERLEEEKKDIASDIRDIFAEAKSVGFDVKTYRRRNKTSQDERGRSRRTRIYA